MPRKAMQNENRLAQKAQKTLSRCSNKERTKAYLTDALILIYAADTFSLIWNDEIVACHQSP
jgi:hypothetical protein